MPDWEKNKIAAAALAILFLTGCATAYDNRGIYHKLGPGEDIWKVARYYRVSPQELAEWNNIMDPAKDMTPGLKLYIPKTREKAPLKYKVRAVRSITQRLPVREEAGFSTTIQFDRTRFVWPVKGTILSPFGIRNGRRHDGIDIKAEDGTPIKAADSGETVFSGQLKGYGNLIIIKHKDRFFTVYAHNSKNLVKKGQKVEKGATIGYVGSTGRATGPHLHFEVREGERARNPLFLLPALVEKDIAVADAKETAKKENTATKSDAKTTKFVRRREMLEKLNAKNKGKKR